MIALYRRLVRETHTVNQLNRIHIALENRITPLELETLRAELTPPAPSWKILAGKLSREFQRKFPGIFKIPQHNFSISLTAQNWVEKLEHMYSHCGKVHPEPFVRRRLHKQIKMFSAGGDRSRKILAICFAGNAQRMMMPMPLFLQHIDAARIDVAFLKDSNRNGFRGGIDGVTTNLGSSIDELKELLNIKEYKSAVTIGTSGGGLPAIMAAVKLGLDAGLSVGGNGPDDPRWLAVDAKGAGDMLRCYARQSSGTPRLFLIFGADNPKDRVAAEALAAIVPAQLIPVSDPSEAVGHNALYQLVKQGKLTEFLEATVLNFPR